MLSTPRPRLGAAQDLVFYWLCRPPSLPIGKARQERSERPDYFDWQAGKQTGSLVFCLVNLEPTSPSCRFDRRYAKGCQHDGDVRS